MDINVADCETLQYLDSPKDAITEIIKARQEQAFYRKRDLLKVPRVGPKTLEKIEGFLCTLPGDIDEVEIRRHTATSSMPDATRPPMPETEDEKLLRTFGFKTKKKDGPFRVFMIDTVFEQETTICHEMPYYVLRTVSKSMNVGDLWCDSGCMHGVGSTDSHSELRDVYQAFGLKPIEAPCAETFQFGDGNRASAKKKWFYPVFVAGTYRGTLDQAEVDVQCPQLLSKMVIEEMGR